MFPPPQFFPSEEFNLCELLLRDRRDDDIAIHFVREGVVGIERITWQQLRSRTRNAADAMIRSGVGPGDVVAAVISNSADAIVLCLATLSVGAIWSSTSCEMGSEAIVDRYAQIKPKLIFADNAYIYAGKLTKLQERIEQWAKELHTLGSDVQNVVVLPYCDVPINFREIPGGLSWDEFEQRAIGRQLSFASLPFSAPAFILFSSGTVSALLHPQSLANWRYMKTGKPKCIVHSAGVS
jgi:acetoacetyl-CoA synthetase